MHYHMSQCQTQVGKFIPPLSRHLTQQRTFSVHHLIMRKLQHKFLTVRIDHAECQLSMMMGTEIGIIFDIFQIVIHPAHIPFIGESQSALLQGTRYPGPCRGFLRNTDGALATLLNHGIEVF